MMNRPSVLCPVDFSGPSRGALRYACALAGHFHGALTVATVNDPLLEHASDVYYGASWLKQEALRELEAFVAQTLGARRQQLAELQFEVATGKPAPQILHIGAVRGADVIVMSTHGRTGVGKRLFGSTAERVLRETSIPVLITPANAVGPEDLEQARRAIRAILAPIDFSEGTPQQVRVAAGAAAAFGASLTLTHVLEPLPEFGGDERFLAGLRHSRQAHAEHTLGDVLADLPQTVHANLVTACGDAAAEIVHLAERCETDLIVMGLHASVGGGPRMGSVTYRVSCQAKTLVLALPPRQDGDRH